MRTSTVRFFAQETHVALLTDWFVLSRLSVSLSLFDSALLILAL